MSFKKKVENFFYYYKWHTAAAIFIIVIAFVAVKSFIGSSEPDLYMVYVSDSPVGTQTSESLEKALDDNKLITDANGDSEAKFYFEPIVVSFDSNSTDTAVLQKLQVYMFAGTQTIMLVHKYVVEDYDGAFEDIGEYCGNPDSEIKGDEGFVTAISVEGNKLLESCGINTENLYIAMHRRTEKQLEKGEFENEYEAAYKALDYILNYE